MSQATGTGVPAVDVLVIWSLAAVAVAGLITLVWRAVRGARRIVDRMDDLADDWNGTPERPGVPARLGVMARLHRIEERMGAVEHELQPNHGHSLRDAVDRVDRRTRTLTSDTDGA
ncbi:hypothetical protein ACIOK4_00090 [Streptomyces bottropensis]|uniref:hypothetical protein n=1 Tax=Streptomyces bottropensis TaxID=42235 RepID=UPI003817E3F1